MNAFFIDFSPGGEMRIGQTIAAPWRPGNFPTSRRRLTPRSTVG